MDRLRLSAVQCPARLGSARSARRRLLLLDLELVTDVSTAAASDDFRRAVDYWAVENAVREALESRAWPRLEDAAEQACSVVLSRQAAVSGVRAQARERGKPGKDGAAVVFLERRRKGSPPADRLSVLGVECRCRVGVPEEERAAPQRIVLDLSVVGRRPDPARCARLARAAAQSGAYLLVEALADRAARAVLRGERRARSVAVRARKRPAVMPRTGEVSVELVRTR